MLHRGHGLAVRHLVAGQLVSEDHPGHVPQALDQSAEELLCGHRVSARLDQNIEHVAPLIWTTTSSRCHLSPGRGPRRRSWFAYSCPNRSHRARFVSWDTSTPRSSISSCTSRKLSGNRWYSQTQWLMISGGNRNPLYDEPAAVTIVDPAPPHQPDSAHRRAGSDRL